VLDAVTSDGSTILAAPQKTRARAPTGKRLPTIRSRAERAEERRYIYLPSLSLSFPLSHGFPTHSSAVRLARVCYQFQ
jgi:hypothetical protein